MAKVSPKEMSWTRTAAARNPLPKKIVTCCKFNTARKWGADRFTLSPLLPGEDLYTRCSRCSSNISASMSPADNKWARTSLVLDHHQFLDADAGFVKSILKESPQNISRMPKGPNHIQSTTTSVLAKPAMHRKSKSKSNTYWSTILKKTVPFSSLNTKEVHNSFMSLTETLITTTTSIITMKNITECSSNISRKRTQSSGRCKIFCALPRIGATSFVTLLTLICIETVLLSTMTNCAKTFYMHWNTSNSIFRIDNTDHIIDVNKGNLAFEFDQVHIICPVYEPGTFENETEKYIIYNVSKVEYETCRITNADPRVIAICDKPQKLMFFTITFRPFTPQPGGLEFLPGNDYYFISTSSKDDLYRRIGGRCSTNNMKVVFKVCCASEEKNKTTLATTAIAAGGVGNVDSSAMDNGAANANINTVNNGNHGQGHNIGIVNTIGTNGANTGLKSVVGGTGGDVQPPIGGFSNSMNTNIDQFNRIPFQPNVMNNNIGAGSTGHGHQISGGIMLSPGHGSINMLPPGRAGVSITQYPGHHHIQTGIRINNVPTQQSYPPHKENNGNDDHHHYDKHPNEVVKNEELTFNSGAAAATSFIQVGTWFSASTMTGLNVLPYVIGFGTQIDNAYRRLTTNMHPMAICAIMIVITFHYLISIVSRAQSMDIRVAKKSIEGRSVCTNR